VFPAIGLVELGALDVAGVLRTVLPEVGRTKLGALTVVGVLISVMDGAVGCVVLGAKTVAGDLYQVGSLAVIGVLISVMAGAVGWVVIGALTVGGVLYVLFSGSGFFAEVGPEPGAEAGAGQRPHDAAHVECMNSGMVSQSPFAAHEAHISSVSTHPPVAASAPCPVFSRISSRASNGDVLEDNRTGTMGTVGALRTASGTNSSGSGRPKSCGAAGSAAAGT
jgi:hypothetical protein